MTTVRMESEFARSTNVERDALTSRVDSYLPTSRGLDVLTRIVKGLRQDGASRAWSITGPYGCGKSSFAVFLDALMSPPTSPVARTAKQRLASLAPQLAAELDMSLEHLRASDRGLIRATVTAEREPVSRTVLRALADGAEKYWSARGRPPALLKELRMESAGKEPLSSSHVLRWVDRLAERAGVLIVIDEFGKSLEHVARATDADDLFVLQLLAERCAASDRRVLLLTLQHLAYEDYFASKGVTLRREWAKVQGRFEDVHFAESAEQTIQLLSEAFVQSTEEFDKRHIAEWASQQYSELRNLGLERFLPKGAELIAQCYPLHSVCLLVLPELCMRYGQYERTLFGFVAGPEPLSVASRLRLAANEEAGPSVITVADVYDYFSSTSAGFVGVGPDAARWFEIKTNIRDSQGLTPPELQCLKLVGVLNLVSRGGAIRASSGLIDFAMPGGIDTPAVMAQLVARGLVTYRAFADEYRIWRGSDFDLSASLQSARTSLADEPLATIMNRVARLGPVVASRHTQMSGTFRYFRRCYVEGSVDVVEPPLIEAPEDGLLVYVLGHGAPRVETRHRGKPVVMAVPCDVECLREAAVEVAGLEATLGDPTLQDDQVGTREVRERLEHGRQTLMELVDYVFQPGQPGVHWRDERDVQVENGLTLSQVLSDVCDRVYCEAPLLRNEMIAVRELSSQGARARRELMEAMLTGATRHQLGIDGYGPERAMYEALFGFSGLHREVEAGGFGFLDPEAATFAPVWTAMMGAIDRSESAPTTIAQLFRELECPPFGLKRGVIPVLVLAGLIRRAQDVGLYQDGSFVAELSAQVIERMIVAPERFSIKAVALTAGRAEVVTRLRATLSGPSATRPTRNKSLLATVAPMIRTVRQLPEYSIKTESLGPRAVGVRSAILEATEPDDLVFTRLPEACGLPAFGARESADDDVVGLYATRLAEALAELESAYSVLLEDIVRRLADLLGTEASLSAVRRRLHSEAEPLRDRVLDVAMKAILTIATDTSLDDSDWLEALVLSIERKPARAFTDRDVAHHEVQLKDAVDRLHRLEALYYHQLSMGSQGGFDAVRVTVTRPDGAEYADVVAVATEDRKALRRVLTDTLERAVAVCGEQSCRSLLAMLAEEVIGRPSTAGDPDVVDASAASRRQNG